jgi:disulfide oxidoreductase YuzD
MKMVPVQTLHMTEDHSRTESGEEKVYRYAQRIRDDKEFLAIVVDTDGVILDGHHRFRAVCDVLKWKKIAALVIQF